MLPYYIAYMDPMDMENPRKIPSTFPRPRLQRFWPCPAPCARRAASSRRISAALPGAPAVEAAGRRGASRGHGPHGVPRRGGARLGEDFMGIYGDFDGELLGNWMENDGTIWSVGLAGFKREAMGATASLDLGIQQRLDMTGCIGCNSAEA